MAVGIHKYNFPYRYVSKWEYGYLGTNPSSFVENNGEKINKEQKTRIHIHRPPLFFFPTFKLSPSYKYPMKNENFRKHVI